MRIAPRLTEVVNQVLAVVDGVVNDASKVAGQMRIMGVEAFLNKLGVLVVLGEDDGLAQAVAAGHFQAMFHQALQHAVHGVRVEEPGVEGGGVHAVGNLAAFVPLQQVPFRLLLVAEVVVGDALAQEAGAHLKGAVGNQIAVRHGLLQVIGVGGYALFQVKKAVSIAVYFVFGRGGEAEEEAVEVVEDGAEFLVDGAVGFVNNHQVKMPHAEQFAPVLLGGVNQVHHRVVGGDDDAGAGGLLLAAGFGEVDGVAGGQVRLERLHGLAHKGGAVSEKEGALHPPGAHEQIHQGNGDARFARARSHHQQPFAIPLTEVFRHAADGFLLIRAVHDGRADGNAVEG